MATGAVPEALGRLRAAADQVRRGWLPATWTRVEGPGQDEYRVKQIEVLGPIGSFEDHLALERGGRLVVACDLDVPDEIAGVPTSGDPLELTLWSIFPIGLRHEADHGARQLLDEAIPPAASGPVLLTVVDALAPGRNGRLVADVRAFDTQVYRAWNWFAFTTPGLRERFELLDVAWAQLKLADAVGATDEERKAVEGAALLVPEDPLALSPAALAGAISEVEAALAPVAPKVEALEVHLIGHSHIDLSWLWTWSDTVEVIKRDVRSVLALMDEFPEMRFTHSQPATYELLRTEEPELFRRVKEHVASGRWEPATMQWVEGDTNMAGHEATARQALEAVTFAREELGAEPTVFLAPDTFGHAGNLPQVTTGAGARTYYHHRCNPGHARGTVWPAYWWEGQDGTRILAVSTPSYNGHLSAGDVARSATFLGLDHGHTTSLLFYGVGDHGGGPTREGLQALRRFQGRPCLPRLRCSTVQAYADAVSASGTALPVHRGESSTTFEGCYTTHADTKRMNREGENLLQTADALTALAGVDHRSELRAAWRSVLFDQFHDIFDGSSIADVYADQASTHEAVVAAAAAAIDESLSVLLADLPPGRVAVVNHLASARTEGVLVEGVDVPAGGRLVAVAADGAVLDAQATEDGVWFVPTVPGFSVRTFELRTATDDEGAAATGLVVDRLVAGERSWVTIETPVLAAKVRSDSGVITSLVDRRTERDLVARGLWDHRSELALGVLQVTDERPHDMSSWDLRDVEAERSLLAGAEVAVVESGPLRAVLAVRHTVRSSTITERITFHRDLPRVDVDLDIDWQEPGNADVGVPGLKMAFTTRLGRPQAWFETPFGAVERPADGQEVPALRWAAVAGTADDGTDAGIAVVNVDKHGYDALGSRLRLTLVRTAYDPDPASDIGTHRTSLSLVPFVGSWTTAALAQTAASRNEPLLVRRTATGPGASLLGTWQPTVSEGPVVVAAAKLAHHGRGRVLRLYESTGASATTRVGGVPDGAAVWEVSIVEDRLRRLTVDAGTIDLSFRPWQIRTILVEQP